MALEDDHARALAALAAACEDAVRRHGADWPRIQAEIDAYLAGLAPSVRQGLSQALSRGPGAPSGDAPDRLH